MVKVLLDNYIPFVLLEIASERRGGRKKVAWFRLQIVQRIFAKRIIKKKQKRRGEKMR